MCLLQPAPEGTLLGAGGNAPFAGCAVHLVLPGPKQEEDNILTCDKLPAARRLHNGPDTFITHEAVQLGPIDPQLSGSLKRGDPCGGQCSPIDERGRVLHEGHSFNIFSL